MPLIKRMLLALIGVILVISGIALFVVPVIPGGILIFIGIPFLVRAEIPKISKWIVSTVNYLEEKTGIRINEKMRKVNGWLKNFYLKLKNKKRR